MTSGKKFLLGRVAVSCPIKGNFPSPAYARSWLRY